MASLQTIQGGSAQQQQSHQQQQQSNVVSKEYYVKVPKTRKRYHALKFHTSNVDLANWNNAEMVRDVIPQTQRQEWEQLPKQGQGSEYGREAREMYRRRKFGFTAKKKNVEDMPWILSNKTSDKHFIGKKSVSENSSYFVFIKCADGGFEASPLADWYSFAPHKTYKTLDYDEAEDQFKIRHKTLNKYYIMANKRKTDGNEDDEEEDVKGASKSGVFSTFGLSSKASKDNWVSDGEDDKKRGKKKSDYKSSNLSDDEDDEEEMMSSKGKGGKKKNEDDDEVIAKEDSDDGDHEGIEMDYSSSDSEQSAPEKHEEKYQEIGIDEEEAIKKQNKSDESESEEDEDEGLTEAGKEYRKLMKKDDDKESDEFDDIFGKGKGNKDDDDSMSSSSFSDSEFETGPIKPKKKSSQDNKFKRKASDESLKKPESKKPVISNDESSSSSSTVTNLTSKSNKTAAIIAAANANQASNGKSAQLTPSGSKSGKEGDKQDSSVLTEDEVRRYLSRKPMTSKELLHKFRGKSQSSQNKMTNQQLVESLRIILDKLKAKMIEQNGVKYLTLP